MEFDWIDTAPALERMIGRLVDEPFVALDTEFHRERSYFPHVGLIQIAGPGSTALVDPVAVDPAPLAALLTGPATIVMHAATQDLEALDRVCGAVPARLFDTQLAAGFVGYRGPSLSTLVERELGVRLPKADRLTDWLRRPLDPTSLRYAAADVAHLLDVAASLRSKLGERGRRAWAEDECEALRRRWPARRDPDEAWWRIKEARQLRGRAARVAQTLAAWRERQAVESDQPARFVLPDLALVGIAQRPPRSPDELRKVRGLDGRHLRAGQGEAILAAVELASSMPASALRLPESRHELDRDLRPAATVASAWVAQLARDLDVDTSLLATRTDIEEFLLDEPDARLRHGWRKDAVGDRLRRLVAGDAALAIDGAAAIVLEERSRRPLE
ncbi:MAG: ribonuclease D [Acidimicrobiales bacterium]